MELRVQKTQETRHVAKQMEQHLQWNAQPKRNCRSEKSGTQSWSEK